jgi:hypothetical protein
MLRKGVSGKALDVPRASASAAKTHRSTSASAAEMHRTAATSSAMHAAATSSAMHAAAATSSATVCRTDRLSRHCKQNQSGKRDS